MPIGYTSWSADSFMFVTKSKPSDVAELVTCSHLLKTGRNIFVCKPWIRSPRRRYNWDAHNPPNIICGRKKFLGKSDVDGGVSPATG